MNQKELTFVCAHCGQDNTIIVEIAKPLAKQSKPVPVPYYCEHCKKANKISLPDNLGGIPPFLDGDQGFLGYTPEGTPRIQGEKYP